MRREGQRYSDLTRSTMRTNATVKNGRITNARNDCRHHDGTPVHGDFAGRANLCAVKSARSVSYGRGKATGIRVKKVADGHRRRRHHLRQHLDATSDIGFSGQRCANLLCGRQTFDRSW